MSILFSDFSCHNFSSMHQNCNVLNHNPKLTKRTESDIEVAHLLVSLSGGPTAYSDFPQRSHYSYRQQSNLTQKDHHQQYSEHSQFPQYSYSHTKYQFHPDAQYQYPSYPYQVLPQHNRNTTNNANKQKRVTSSATLLGSKKLVLAPDGKICPNCSTSYSTLWRNCGLLNGSRYLCNGCGLRFKKGKYCPLCYEVYYDADTNHFNWEQCKDCSNWTHKSCLQKLNSPKFKPSGYVCNHCLRGRFITPKEQKKKECYDPKKNSANVGV